MSFAKSGNFVRTFHILPVVIRWDVRRLMAHLMAHLMYFCSNGDCELWVRLYDGAIGYAEL